MFALILTVYLQACATCEINHESNIVMATNDKFACEVMAKRLIILYTVNEYDVKQFASAKCEETK